MTTSRRILAVDQDQAFLAQLNAKLTPAGFDIKALKEPTRVVPEATAFAPDLVLMDRVLPILTGAETIRSLRAFPKTQRIPVAFVVHAATENEILRSIQAGAVDVLCKPLAPAHVPRLSGLIDEMRQRPIDPARPIHLAAVDHLLGFYRREKRTGVLQVNAGTPFEGRARFEDGELVESEYGPLRGKEAIEEMLQIDDGQWRFLAPGQNAPTMRPLRPSLQVDADLDGEADTPVPVEVETVTPPLGKQQPYSPRVLVVDDEPALRRLFATQLMQAGLKADQAEDGERAYEFARQREYDLVLSDLHMPKVDGWGLLQKLKADARTREAPVVFLSAHDDYRETLKVARAGAHDYLSKTGRSEDIVSRVLALLTPKLEFQVVLESGLAVGGIQLTQLGPQWLMRALARSKATGTLRVADDWAEYFVAFDKGEPVAAKAKTNNREVSGVAAVASFILCRHGEGAFNPGPAPSGQRFGMDVETLLTKACDALNQLDSNAVQAKLASGAELEVDETLYELFRRVGSDRAVQLAHALCEEKLPLEEVAQHLGVPGAQVIQGTIELLQRGVIRFK